MKIKKQNDDRLQYWQGKLSAYKAAWDDETAKMSDREAIYKGRDKINKVIKHDVVTEAKHIRNLAAEIIEAEVDSNVPQPKVTALYREDETLSTLIEDMIRNKLDKWPSEELNDQLERTVPIQGGAFTVLEWDNSKRTHNSVGESVIAFIHPKQIAPQPGVTSGIEDMDSFILRHPHTKQYIKNRYGVDVSDVGEDEPEIRGDDDSAADMVTQYVAYYRNDKGGVGMFSWVGDVVLCDYEDYQSRRLPKCTKCGRVMNTENLVPLAKPSIDGNYPGGLEFHVNDDGVFEAEGEIEVEESDKPACVYCGNDKFEDADAEYEEVWDEVVITDEEGKEIKRIPGASWVETDEQEVDADGNPLFDESGNPVMVMEYKPTMIPYYKPDIFPVTLHRNVSVWGDLLGASDIDMIEDQQNTYNRLAQKVLDEMLMCGSYITLPNDPAIKIDSGDGKVIRLSKPDQKAMIDVYTLQADISQPLNMMSWVYEEARQLIGITDSFQGRRDSTATSGKAKEFAAAQSAGRLMSKRVMKRAAWSHIFEAIFKFELAYADEPRPVVGFDKNGNHRDEEWNKYLFLEQDDAGEWYWNDEFLFSCDEDSPLAQNRTAMWSELRSMYVEGDFGDPTQTDTRILYWQAMEEWHYPGAAKMKKSLIEKKQKELEMQAAQAQAQVNAIHAANADVQQRGGMI